MKFSLSMLSGIATFIFGFWLDSKFIHWALTQFPVSAHEWLGIIKVILWLITFGFTFSMSMFLAYLVGGLVAIVLSGTGKSKTTIRRF